MPQQLIHCIFISAIRCYIAVLGIVLQQPLALQKAGNAPCDGVGELCEFIARWRLDPAKPHGRSGAIDIDTIEEPDDRRHRIEARIDGCVMTQGTQGTQGYLMGLGKRAFIRPIPAGSRSGNAL